MSRAATESSTDERILDAALVVLAREGIGGVSMRAVARQAEVAVGLANYHFDGKTALISAALERIGERDMDLVTPPDGMGADEALTHSLRLAFDNSFLTPAYLSLRLQLWSHAGVNEAYAEINRRAQHRYRDGLATLIADARPDLDAVEVDRRAADILTVKNGVWLTAILIPDDEAVARALVSCERLALD